jgi:hypothetical protein
MRLGKLLGEIRQVRQNMLTMWLGKFLSTYVYHVVRKILGTHVYHVFMINIFHYPFDHGQYFCFG